MDGERMVRAAVEGGGMGALQWGVQCRGWALPRRICHWAARAGQHEVLQWARASGYSWDCTIRSEASRGVGGGHLEILLWL